MHSSVVVIGFVCAVPTSRTTGSASSIKILLTVKILRSGRVAMAQGSRGSLGGQQIIDN